MDQEIPNEIPEEIKMENTAKKLRGSTYFLANSFLIRNPFENLWNKRSFLGKYLDKTYTKCSTLTFQRLPKIRLRNKKLATRKYRQMSKTFFEIFCLYKMSFWNFEEHSQNFIHRFMVGTQDINHRLVIHEHKSNEVEKWERENGKRILN